MKKVLKIVMIALFVSSATLVSCEKEEVVIETDADGACGKGFHYIESIDACVPTDDREE